MPKSTLFVAAGLILLLCTSCSKPETAVAPSPSAPSLGPASGSGTSSHFLLQLPQSSGAGKLVFAQVLFSNSDPASLPFCFVHYDPVHNQMKLYKGPGAEDFTPTAAPGTASDAVQNNSCRVDTASSSASVKPTGITLNLAVDFLAPMVGDRVTYWRTLDEAGKDTGWQRAGTWTVPPYAR